MKGLLREASLLLFCSLRALKVSIVTLFSDDDWIESLRRQTLLLSSERGFRRRKASLVILDSIDCSLSSLSS